MLPLRLLTLTAVVATTSAQTACQDEASCQAAALLSESSSFRVLATQTKGCFGKGGTVYWSPGGTEEENSRPAPGQQIRIFCDGIGEATTTFATATGLRSTTFATVVDNFTFGTATAESVVTTTQAATTEAPSPTVTSEGIPGLFTDSPTFILSRTCLTADACEARASELGLAWGGTGPTKGCFRKGGTVYFGPGTVEEIENTDPPGVQERVVCPPPETEELEVTTEPTESVLTTTEATAPIATTTTGMPASCTAEVYGCLTSSITQVCAAVIAQECSEDISQCLVDVNGGDFVEINAVCGAASCLIGQRDESDCRCDFVGAQCDGTGVGCDASECCESANGDVGAMAACFLEPVTDGGPTEEEVFEEVNSEGDAVGSETAATDDFVGWEPIADDGEPPMEDADDLEEDPSLSAEEEGSMSMPAGKPDITWTVDGIDAENNPELAGDGEELGRISLAPTKEPARPPPVSAAVGFSAGRLLAFGSVWLSLVVLSC